MSAESNLPVRQPLTPSTATLQQLSSSLVAISRQVEPAVVQIYELGNLMLHGQTRPIDLRVVNTQLHYRRTAVLQQTEFGIKPITVGGGTIKVKDEVKIDVDIVIRQR